MAPGTSARRTYTVATVLAVLDWSTIASLATAAGTLILAIATFSSVRSANRSARVAERALMVNLRPVLASTRLDDPVQKIGFVDGKWLVAPGGGGAAEVDGDVVYLGVAVRNAGNGLAVLHGWSLLPGPDLAGVPHADPEDFRRLTRDLYVPPADVGFWQGALRDPAEPLFAAIREAILEPRRFAVDVLYGDHEGGQRTITRFMMAPYNERWIASVSRHWNIDRPDPR